MFGELSLPEIEDDGELRPRARSLGDAGEDETGPFFLPEYTPKEYMERALQREQQFG